MAYGFTAALTVPVPTGSHTDFTLCLIGTDLKMATVANGGAVVNTVTRVGQTVPADLVLSSDAAASSLYSWGWDFYSAVTGQVIIWVKIPSYTAGMTIYISVGNAAVVAYQGGAQGAEFDSSTWGAYHFPDASALSVKDFSASAYDLTNSAATAGAGKIDGGIVTASSKFADSPTVATTVSLTVSTWIKTSSSGNFQMAFSAINASQYELRLNATNFAHFAFGYPLGSGTLEVTGSTSLADGNWHQLVGAYPSGGKIKLYVDGALIATGASNTNYPSAFTTFRVGGRQGDNSYPLIGTMDELRLSSVERSANWIATEYANQNNPPVIGAFTANGTISRLSLLGAG